MLQVIHFAKILDFSALIIKETNCFQFIKELVRENALFVFVFGEGF
jgi:hypothetical protein